jgi:hypothetical protein
VTKDGNIKFYDKNLIDSDCSFVFTSATVANASFIYDNNSKTRLSSNGSNDATPEVWEITFARTVAFNRAFLGGHNLLNAKIEYWNGAAYVDFNPAASFVTSTIDGILFEFDMVNTTKIRLTMNTTQIMNSNKTVTEFRIFKELGSVSMNPAKAKNEFPNADKEYTTSNGGTVYVYFGEKFKTKLSFGKASVADMALFRSLKERGEPFYIYLCGGIDSYLEEYFRVSDMYFVLMPSDLTSSLVGDLHSGLLKIDISLKEV